MNHGSARDVEVLLGERPILVLSPHLDDAWLSAWAVLHGYGPEVWTAFAGRPVPAVSTTWDDACGFVDSDATMNARLDEDAAAFANSGLTVRHLPALDGAYTTPERRHRDLGLLTADLCDWMSEHPDGAVLAPAGAGLHVPEAWWQRAHRLVSTPAAPSEDARNGDAAAPAPTPEQPTPRAQHLRAVTQKATTTAKRRTQELLHADAQRRRRHVLGADGLGANPDHLALRDLVLDAAPQHPGIRVVLYEDLPYLWHERGDAEVARVARRRHLTTRRFDLPVDREAKAERLQHYASQLPVMDTRGRLLDTAALPSSEVYWSVEG